MVIVLPSHTAGKCQNLHLNPALLTLSWVMYEVSLALKCPRGCKALRAFTHRLSQGHPAPYHCLGILTGSGTLTLLLSCLFPSREIEIFLPVLIQRLLFSLTVIYSLIITFTGLKSWGGNADQVKFILGTF